MNVCNFEAREGRLGGRRKYFAGGEIELTIGIYILLHRGENGN